MHISPADQRAAWRLNGALLMGFALFLLFLPALMRMMGSAWGMAPEGWVAYFALVSLLHVWGGSLYAKSKGYAAAWGWISVPFLLLPGTVILMLLADKWSPAKQDWLEMPNRLLVDNQSYQHDYEVAIMLNRSWKSKIGTALGLGAGSLGCYLLHFQVSPDSRATLLTAAALFLTGAIPLWLHGSAHLAREKGYDPLWVSLGFVFFPMGAMGLFTGPDQVRFTMTVTFVMMLGLLLGPIFLFLAPRRFVVVKKSPFGTDPASFYLANTRHHPYAHD